MAAKAQKIQLILICILAVAIIILYYLQLTGGNKTACINNNRLLMNYKGMEAASKEYKKKISEWEANIDTLATILEKEVTAYKTDSGSMNIEKRREALQRIETRRMQLSNYHKAMEQKAADQDKKMTGEVLKKVSRFIKEYGENNGYTIILGATSSGKVLYAGEAIDITDEILEIINNEYQ